MSRTEYFNVDKEMAYYIIGDAPSIEYKIKRRTGRPKNHGGGKPPRAVIKYDLEGNFIKEYISLADAAKDVGIEKSTICQAAKKDSGTAGGFIWKYKQHNHQNQQSNE